ncbi:MAG: hypothetical protein R8M14_05975 [Ghiorsea sp.]
MKTIWFKLTITAFLLTMLSACQTSQAQKQINDDNDKRAELHYKLGLDAIHKGTIPKAFEELYISDKLLPNQPDTLDAIAYAWRLRGNNKKAEAFYQRAIEVDASSATYNNYGSLLVELGKYKEAITNLNIALEDPRYRNQSLAFINLGNAYIGLKDLEHGVSSYRKASMLSPNWSYPQLRAAAAYSQFNRPNYAQALYETILRKEPANHQALAELIKLLKNTGQNSLLRSYINTFIVSTEDKLQQAWAKDELTLLNTGK